MKHKPNQREGALSVQNCSFMVIRFGGLLATVIASLVLRFGTVLGFWTDGHAGKNILGIIVISA